MSGERSTEGELVRRTLIVCGIVVAILATVVLLVVARSVLPLVFGASLIAVVLNRLATNLSSIFPRTLPRRVRVSLVVGSITVVTVGSMYAFANSAGEHIVKLTNRIESSAQTVIDASKEHPLIQRFMNDQQEVSSLIATSSGESFGAAKRFFSTTFGAVADCLVLAILSIYFFISPERYRVGVLRLMPVAWRDRLTCLLSDSANTLWRWMIGRLLAMTIVGVLFGVGLAAIGTPMPVELGIFAGLVTFIPNIGGLAALLPALLVASQQGTQAVMSVVILYLAIQLVESYFVTPLVQEHQVALPPAMVIVAQILAGLVFGFWGIVFATPMVAVVLLWTKDLYVDHWIEAR